MTCTNWRLNCNDFGEIDKYCVGHLNGKKIKKHVYNKRKIHFSFLLERKKQICWTINARQPRRSIAENVVRETAGRTSLRFRSVNHYFFEFFLLSRYRSKTDYGPVNVESNTVDCEKLAARL